MVNYRDGKLFQYENDFFAKPRKYDYINLFQVGELFSCHDYEVPLHEQLCSEISYIISGSGKFYVNGKEYEVNAGDLFINCFGEQHRIKASKQDNLRYFYMGFSIDSGMISEKQDLIKMFEFFSTHHDQPICHCKYDITISMMSRLINEFYNGGELSEFVIENMLKQIIIDVYRSYVNKENKTIKLPKDEASAGNVLYKVINYIDNHIYDIVKIEDIARNIGYSPTYISHLFREKTGITTQHYLITKKIEKSIELMHEGQRNITERASLLNYETLQSFSRTFKNITGISPSEYLKRMS